MKKQIGRLAKSVYDMTTKQYMRYLRKNRITKGWIIEIVETYEEIKVDSKLTLKEIIEKYGNDLKYAVNESCFEL